MPNYVKDKVIIVTGAASGFGRLVSEKTAALGGKLVCADINAQQLGAATATIASAASPPRNSVWQSRRRNTAADCGIVPSSLYQLD